jgi:hypothetical protein
VQDPYTHRTNWAAIIGWTALVVAVLAIVAGVMYMTMPAHSLPSLLGRLPNATSHRTKRGIAALVAGIVLLVIGGVALIRSRREA